MKDLHRWDFTSGIAALLIIFLIILFPGPAKCEEEFGFWVSYAQGIKITCTPTSFEVAAYTLNDRPTAAVVKKGKGETIYYGFKKREINCLFGKHKMKVSFTTDEPREKGMCGAVPGSSVNIWIDGQQEMKQQLFNNECYESLMSASFEQEKEGHFVFKICGHERMSGRPINNECFVFQEEAFWSLPKPLPMSPITELKEKGYRKEIHAASFDCGKAASEVEKLICSDDELSKLDDSLSKAYLQALKRADIKEQTIRSQRQWLKNERNTCQNAECIRKAYETRIKELGLPDEGAQTKTGQQHESTTDTDEDITRSLTMTCNYCDYETFQDESVSLAQTTENQGKPAAVKKFKRGSSQRETETFIVRPGQFAECIYPSGTRVRVKVGEGLSKAYGECGADPEVFMSLWVNERKIVSRLWFAGHCREHGPNPAVSFKILGMHNRVSFEKCHTAICRGNDLTSENDILKKDAAKPLSVCVDFPDVSKYPKDLVEYPPEGVKTPKVGDIEIMYGSGPVCQAVLDELTRDFSLYNIPVQSKTGLSQPNWSEPSAESPKVELPKELAGGGETIFDFNNDGKLDRVFSRGFYNTYMEGDVWLVQPGRSSSELVVSASPMEDKNSIYLPFHLGEVRSNIYDYPPFSQKNDEAGFSMKGRNEKDEVYFRGRYSTISFFTFRGATYIAVGSNSEDTKNYVAVLKPLPDGRFQKIGLFRRVSENF